MQQRVRVKRALLASIISQLPPARICHRPVEHRHHGDQNKNLDIKPDFSMHLDPTLPTAEEV